MRGKDAVHDVDETAHATHTEISRALIDDFTNLRGRDAGVERLRQTDLEFFLSAATEQRGKNDEVAVSFTQNGLDRLATSSSSKYLKKRAYSGSVFARSEIAGAAAAAGLSADMKTAPAASPADPPKRLRRERDFSGH